MPPQQRVAVFVSSTFRDMVAERDHLLTIVFPELRERLRLLRLELQDVDLRWGVPASRADEERTNPWEYCRRSIDQIEPFFICLLGQRYGWVPSAAELAGDAAYSGLSITEMEIRHAALSGRVRRRSYFYIRQTPVPLDAPPDIYATFVQDDQQEALAALKQAIAAQPGGFIRFYECRWQGSGFGDLESFGQMVLEDLWSGVLRDPRYVPLEAWQAALGGDPLSDPRYLDEGSPVAEPVWLAILGAIQPVRLGTADDVRQGMARFAERSARWLEGRERELGILDRFIVDDAGPRASRTAIVSGAPGQGKSALLARLYLDLEKSPHRVVYHAVGATAERSDADRLCARIYEELDELGIPCSIREKNVAELPGRLRLRLQDYEGRGVRHTLVILVDGADHLAGRPWAWLPARLGDRVRLVLSADSPPPDGSMRPRAPEWGAIRERLASRPLEIRLPDLSPDVIQRITIRYLAEYCKALDDDLREVLSRMPQCRNPLYLMLMLDQLRLFGGTDTYLQIPDLIRTFAVRCPDSGSLFEWLLERLESAFGVDAVLAWCQYLVSGRAGMAGEDLRLLMSGRFSPDGERLATRIERGLREFLVYRGDLWAFVHDRLREAVSRRYPLDQPARLHAQIAAHFGGRWRLPDRHALGELLYHQREAGLTGELNATLADTEFLHRRLLSFGPADTRIEYAECAPAVDPENRAALLTVLDGLASAPEDWSERSIGSVCCNLAAFGAAQRQHAVPPYFQQLMTQGSVVPWLALRAVQRYGTLPSIPAGESPALALSPRNGTVAIGWAEGCWFIRPGGEPVGVTLPASCVFFDRSGERAACLHGRQMAVVETATGRVLDQSRRTAGLALAGCFDDEGRLITVGDHLCRYDWRTRRASVFQFWGRETLTAVIKIGEDCYLAGGRHLPELKVCHLPPGLDPASSPGRAITVTLDEFRNKPVSTLAVVDQETVMAAAAESIHHIRFERHGITARNVRRIRTRPADVEAGRPGRQAFLGRGSWVTFVDQSVVKIAGLANQLFRPPEDVWLGNGRMMSLVSDGDAHAFLVQVIERDVFVLVFQLVEQPTAAVPARA